MQATTERDKKRIAEVKDTSSKVVETCSRGDCWRQGDLQILFLGPGKPNTELKPTETPSQLAPGETKGSRHVLVASNVEAFDLVGKQPLEGPVLLCPEGLTVEHPEHGDVTLKEPGYYAITYQRAFAEEIQRQAD